MTPHNPIEALASTGDIELQARIAAGEQPAPRAARSGILLRVVDASAESILVAALLGELGLASPPGVSLRSRNRGLRQNSEKLPRTDPRQCGDSGPIR